MGIIWCILVCVYRNNGALKAGKKLYIYLCGLCVARDMFFGVNAFPLAGLYREVKCSLPIVFTPPFQIAAISKL
jgi:hypothetical protein